MVFRSKKDKNAKQTPSKVGSKFSAGAGDDEDQVVKTPNAKNIKQKQIGSDKKVSFQVSSKATPAEKKTPKGENSHVKMQLTPGNRSLKQFPGISKNTQKTNGKAKKNIQNESDDDDDDDDEDEDLDMLLGNEDEEMDEDESEADEQDAEDDDEEEDDDEMDEEESDEEESKIQVTQNQMKTMQTSKNIKNKKKLAKEETKNTPSKNIQSSGKNAAKAQMQKSVLKTKRADDNEDDDDDESDEESDEDESEESKMQITQNQVKAAQTSKKNKSNEKLTKEEAKTPSKNTQSPAKNTAKVQKQKPVLKPKSGDDSEDDEEDDSEDDEEDDEDESEEVDDEESKEKETKEFEIQTQPSKAKVENKDVHGDTLYVGNLGGVALEEVKALSSDIVDVRFSKKFEGKPLLYAFLKFESAEKAEENYKLLKTKKLNGQTFKVDYCVSRNTNEQRGDVDDVSGNMQRDYNKKKLFVSGLKPDVTVGEVAQFFPNAQTVSVFKLANQNKAASIYYVFAEDAAKDLETAKFAEINDNPIEVTYGFASRQEKRPFQNNYGENSSFGNRGKRGRYSGNRGQRGTGYGGRGQRGRRGQGGWNTESRGQRGGFSPNKGVFKFQKTEYNDNMEE